MRTNDLALDHIDRTELTLDEVRSAFKKKVYSLTIRRSQETVELSLKSALRFLAIEYPGDHDVSDVLLRIKETRQRENIWLPSSRITIRCTNTMFSNIKRDYFSVL